MKGMCRLFWLLIYPVVLKLQFSILKTVNSSLRCNRRKWSLHPFKPQVGWRRCQDKTELAPRSSARFVLSQGPVMTTCFRLDALIFIWQLTVLEMVHVTSIIIDVMVWFIKSRGELHWCIHVEMFLLGLCSVVWSDNCKVVDSNPTKVIPMGKMIMTGYINKMF